MIRQRLECPTHATRLQIFQPTRRPMLAVREVSTPWGWARVAGRLGQTHLGLLEIIYSVATERLMVADLLSVVVDPAALRRETGLNRREIDRLLSDLMDARVAAKIAARQIDVEESGLVSRVVRDAGPAARRPGAINAGRASLWRIDFGLVWTELLASDLVTFTPPQVHLMSYGVSQAVARFCIGHQHVNEHIGALLQRLGATRRTDKLTAELTEDADLLQQVGIEIIGGIVRKTPVARPQNPGKTPFLAAKPRKKPSLSIEFNKNSIATGPFVRGPAASMISTAADPTPAAALGEECHG